MTNDDDEVHTRCADGRDAERETTRRRSGHHPAVRAETKRQMSEPQRRVVWRLKFQSKTLRFRRGNYSRRRIVPFVERGPFGCWLASWSWGQIGWELNRWT